MEPADEWWWRGKVDDCISGPFDPSEVSKGGHAISVAIDTATTDFAKRPEFVRTRRTLDE